MKFNFPACAYATYFINEHSVWGRCADDSEGNIRVGFAVNTRLSAILFWFALARPAHATECAFCRLLSRVGRLGTVFTYAPT